MTLLLLVFRVIIVLLIVRFVLRFIASIREGARPAARPRPMAERTGGTLVRDPNCGTYLPESRAITVGALHFCSSACRDAYAAAHRGSASGSALTS